MGTPENKSGASMKATIAAYREAVRSAPALARSYVAAGRGIATRAGTTAWSALTAPRSLRRAATIDRWRRLQLPLREKLLEEAKSLWRYATTGARPFLWITGVAFMILFLPIPAHWSFRAFTGTNGSDTAQSYLSTLMQVGSAGIGLSLAVALGLFAVIDAEKRGLPGRLAKEATLTLALWAAALLDMGAVLLHLGPGAPGGFAATWSTLVSLAAFVSVVVVFQRLFAAWTRRRRGESRQRATREATFAATDEAIFRRIAMMILAEQAKVAGVELRGYFGHTRTPGDQRIYAGREGRVVDVCLAKLRRLGKRYPGRVKLLVDFNARVVAETPLVVIPAEASPRDRRAAQKLFRIDQRESRGEALRDELEWLHEAAVEAIRDGLPKTYNEIVDEYLEALYALPMAWKRYGETYSFGAAQGLGLFEKSELEWFEDSLRYELREACRGSHVEVAAAAFGIPFWVARRAFEMDAEALFVRMLRLYADVYPNVARAPDPDVKRRVRHSCLNLTAEYAKIYLAHPISDKDTDEEKRDKCVRYLAAAQVKIADMARTAMDVDPSDVAALAEINNHWTDFWTHWNPAHERPFDWEVDHARETLGPDHPDTIALEAQAVEQARLAQIKNDAELLRDSLRFGLAWWAFRRLQQKHDDVWVGPFTAFRQYFGSAKRLTRAFVYAAKHGDDDDGPWFSWLLQDTFGARVMPHLNDAMLEAYLTIAILIAPAAFPAPTIPPIGFSGSSELRRVKDRLVAVANDTALWSVIDPPPDMPRRVAVVWRMIRRAT